ncbi:MAG: hypothetical protein AVDCRST_MAG01-01-2727, partial [uncultured Rubrobacteraceae bacterium]
EQEHQEVRRGGGYPGRGDARARLRRGLPDLRSLQGGGQGHVLRRARLYPHNRRRDVRPAARGRRRGLLLPGRPARQGRQNRLLADAGGLRARGGRRPRHHRRRPGRGRRGHPRRPGHHRPPPLAGAVHARLGDLRRRAPAQGHAPEDGRPARRGRTGRALRAVRGRPQPGDGPHHGVRGRHGPRMGRAGLRAPRGAGDFVRARRDRREAGARGPV